MGTTLKLNINSSVLRRAEAYAHKQGSDLSNLVEDYLRRIAESAATPDKERKGSMPAASDALMGKYLG